MYFKTIRVHTCVFNIYFWGVNICVVFLLNFHASKLYPRTLNIEKMSNGLTIKQPYACLKIYTNCYRKPLLLYICFQYASNF